MIQEGSVYEVLVGSQDHDNPMLIGQEIINILEFFEYRLDDFEHRPATKREVILAKLKEKVVVS
jgi:hypothetical protein